MRQNDTHTKQYGTCKHISESIRGVCACVQLMYSGGSPQPRLQSTLVIKGDCAIYWGNKTLT